MLDRMLKWLMIMAASEGVGQNSEQLVTAAQGGRGPAGGGVRDRG